MKHNILFIFLFFCTSVLLAQASEKPTMLLREPTLSENHIVFVYADDLWIVNKEGGSANRLTSNMGKEQLPHFSPDESHIAFSAEYDGNTDVYVIPAQGGTPKRLTWHPGGDFVQGWTPDGKVIFRSGRASHPTQTNRLYKVSTDGGFPEPVNVPRAAYGEMSADGNYLAYTPITSWDPEWRNYRGGQAMPIWIVDLNTLDLTRTPQKDQERHLDPVWLNNKVYYLSERDYASNIWSFDPMSREEKQETFHSQFDVKSLDASASAIVYEMGGRLHLLDPTNGKTTTPDIFVHADASFSRPRWEDIPSARLQNASLSPSGKYALFEYRGEIFTVSVDDPSNWYNLSENSAAADRYPAWSPKGDRVIWFSDQMGEYQLAISDPFGHQKVTYTALPEPSFYFSPVFSPDGSAIAYTDTHYNLWIYQLDSGKAHKVDTDRFAHPERSMQAVWSADSKWIAYSKRVDTQFRAIFAFDVDKKENVQVTNAMADAIQPVWDENNRYLYFLASTNFGLNTGWLDMSSYDPDASYHPYVAILDADDKTPFYPTMPTDVADSDVEKDQEKAVVQITTEGLMHRIVALDVKADDYVALFPSSKGSLLLGVMPSSSNSWDLKKYSLSDQKMSDFASSVNATSVSADRSKVLLRAGSRWLVSSVSSKADPSKDGLSMNLRLRIDPKGEYRQIFNDGWRFMRDFLYVDNVHGAPWDKIKQWYSPWIDHVRHRTDLNYVMDILSGEVSVGHSYVRGGDMPDIDQVDIGLLGADFQIIDGRYQIAKIYRGGEWNPDVYAPLAQVGSAVQEGHFILSINGLEVDATSNIYALLEETVDRNTVLEIAETVNAKDRIEVLVKPVNSERNLRYHDWVEGNRRKVDELSNGQLAYVYVPNTSNPGFTSFNRYYFAQQDKKGVIIDERNNGGGSAADYMIDVMSRKLFGYFNSKAGDNKPWTTPMAGIFGPKVMLINERAGSGGDLLPYMFKEAELGSLVGTRTWGGLVGTWDTPPFVDGGRFVAPRGGFFDVNGEWAVEGVGISPDIEVIQHPKEVMNGMDPQLEAGVKEAMRLLQTQEVKFKSEPAAPIRWKRPSKMED